MKKCLEFLFTLALAAVIGSSQALAIGMDPLCTKQGLERELASHVLSNGIEVSSQEFYLDHADDGTYLVFKVSRYRVPNQDGYYEVYSTEARSGSPPAELAPGGLHEREQRLNEVMDFNRDNYWARRGYSDEAIKTEREYFELFADQSKYVVRRSDRDGSIEASIRFVTVEYEVSRQGKDGAEEVKPVGQSQVAASRKGLHRDLPGWERLGTALPTEIYLGVSFDTEAAGYIRRLENGQMRMVGRGAKVEAGTFVIKPGLDPKVFVQLYFTEIMKHALDLPIPPEAVRIYAEADPANARNWKRQAYRDAEYTNSAGQRSSSPIPMEGKVWQPLTTDIPSLRAALDHLGNLRRNLTAEEVQEMYDIFQALTGIDVVEQKSGLHLLPEPQLEAYRLCEIQGMSEREAARVMGVDRSTLKRLLSAAKAVVERPSETRPEAVDSNPGRLLAYRKFDSLLRLMAARLDLRERLSAAIELLPARQRLLVRSVYLEGRPLDEIAHELGRQTVYAKNSLNLGLRELRAYLGKEGELLPPRAGDPKNLIRYLRFAFPQRFDSWMLAVPVRLQKLILLHDIDERPTQEIIAETGLGSGKVGNYYALNSARAYLMEAARKGGVEIPSFTAKKADTPLNFLTFVAESMPDALVDLIGAHNGALREWQVAKRYFVDGLDVAEIAEELGIEEATVLGHLYRVSPELVGELEKKGIVYAPKPDGVVFAGRGTTHYGFLDPNDLQQMAKLDGKARTAISQAVTELPEAQRRYAEPFFLGGQSKETIAKDQGVQVFTVDKQIRAATAILRSRISVGGELIPRVVSASVDEQIRAFATSAETKALFDQVAEKLGPIAGQAARLYFQQGMSLEQIQKSIPTATRSTISKARRTLVAEINNGGGQSIVAPTDLDAELDQSFRDFIKREGEARGRELLSDMTPKQRETAEDYYFKQGTTLYDIDDRRGVARGSSLLNLKLIRTKLSRRPELQGGNQATLDIETTRAISKLVMSMEGTISRKQLDERLRAYAKSGETSERFLELLQGVPRGSPQVVEAFYVRGWDYDRISREFKKDRNRVLVDISMASHYLAEKLGDEGVEGISLPEFPLSKMDQSLSESLPRDREAATGLLRNMGLSGGDLEIAERRYVQSLSIDGVAKALKKEPKYIRNQLVGIRLKIRLAIGKAKRAVASDGTQ